MSRKRPRLSGRLVPKYQAPTGLPTERDINVYDSLDEQSAAKHFLGKDLTQARSLFRENFLYYQEDLMFMGPVAFHFYVPAAIDYLSSEDANHDTDAASTFSGVIEHRLEWESDLIAPVASIIREGILAILEGFDRFGFGGEDIGDMYGDVAGGYRVLLSRLDDLARSPELE